MRTIAVTGGSGKLGRYVIEELRRQGYLAVSLDHRIAEGLPCKQTRVDMSDLGQVVGGLKGADAVIHLAAIPAPLGYPHHTIFANNVLGSFHVLEAAELLGIRRVVMGSSTSCYGFAWASKPFSPAYLPVDEAHPQLPQEGYGLSKTVGELTSDMFARRGALEIANLRFSLIAAPEEYGRMAEDARHPERFSKILWSYIDIRDAATACTAALTARLEGGSVSLNITGDEVLSERDTSALIAEHYPEVTDIRADLGGRAPLFSNALAKETLNWRPIYKWR
ncbi:NAD-dependent epimerase/dehydratase family protein [Cohnella hashimotonis]|uniref:NAD(P)-dependent oxidoreductase n=1 Tax=Cohnella hashimotonis TaxID=2826895 RepID=A0ABT6TJE9_9BACL|nr:NAD(P)-dependent oxidoreductase [Cohnella hashimotonis]MDI4646850.1 NAD(P)-dependent oxidoreductase [Cohnella hashimotonis]